MLVGEGFFGALFGGDSFRFVQVFGAGRGVGEDGDDVRLHFEHAAGDVEGFFRAAFGADAHFAGTDFGEQWGVARQDSDFTQHCRRKHHGGATGVDLGFGAYDIYVHNHDHIRFSLLAPSPLPSPACGRGGAGEHIWLLKFLRFFHGLVDAADHVEGLLGQVVVFAAGDGLEAGDGVLQRDVFAGRAGEHFGGEEGLRQGALDFTGTRHGEAVVFRQFIHAENRDDVFELFVALQNALHHARGVVVFLAHDQRIELAAGGVERIDRGVDAELGDVTRQHHGGVQVREGGGRRRVGQVVGGHVHGLDGGDGAGLGGGDALLQHAHLFRQRRLITHRRRHTAEQRGHIGAGKRVAIDVVDEQQHVAAFVAEVFGHGETGQRDAETIAGRLVHLAVHEGHFVQDIGVFHLVVEVVAFAGTLAHAGEDRVTAVLDGDVADELHHVDGLAHAGAAEQADLAAFGERADQIDDLDAGFKQHGGGRLLFEARCLAVDGPAVFFTDGTGCVDGLAEHVHDAAEGFDTDRHLDGRAGAGDAETALQAVGGTHGDGTHHAVTQLLLHLEGQAGVRDVQRVIDLGHGITRKFHVDHRADNLYDLAGPPRFSPLYLSESVCARRMSASRTNLFTLWSTRSECHRRSHRGSAAADLRNLLGVRRLARLVVDELQVGDEVAGVG